MDRGEPLMSGGLGRRLQPFAVESSRARARMLLAERESDEHRPESDPESDSDIDFPLRRSRDWSRTPRFTERMSFADRMGRSGRVIPEYDEVYPLDSASSRPRFIDGSTSSYDYIYPDEGPSRGVSRRPHFRRRDFISNLDTGFTMAPRRRSYVSDRDIDQLYTLSRHPRSPRNSLESFSTTNWPRSRAAPLNNFRRRDRSPSPSNYTRADRPHRYRRSSNGANIHIHAPQSHNTYAPSIHLHTHTHHHHHHQVQDPYTSPAHQHTHFPIPSPTQPLNVPHYPPGTPLDGPGIRLPHPMFGRAGMPPTGGMTFYPTADGRRAVAGPGGRGRRLREGFEGHPGY